MRRAAVLALATAAFALPFTVGAQTTHSDQSQIQSAEDGAAPAAPTEKRLLTPEQEGRQGVVKGVLVQPFRDFGLIESRIPRVLLEAMADPYARVRPVTCDALTVRIRELDGALGPDMDAPIDTERPSMVRKGKGDARDAGLDAMRGAEQSYIPFDGAIRAVSGANRHDHRVLNAIKAGSMRRSYLKGLGESIGCPAPATPRHLAHPVTVAAEQPAKRR
ncbi:MAG TPA: hypothetical protein VGF50_02040 [Caulobacteraceae bacterium]|jgi:hypothetical protein